MEKDFLDALVIEAERLGWKNTRRNSSMHGNELSDKFDSVSEKKIALISKWFLLLDRVSYFDGDAYIEHRNKYESANESVKSHIFGSSFIYGIICDRLSESVASSPLLEKMSDVRVLKMKGGGGIAYVVDKNSKLIYGKVPAFPLDAHKCSKEFSNAVKSVLSR